MPRKWDDFWYVKKTTPGHIFFTCVLRVFCPCVWPKKGFRSAPGSAQIGRDLRGRLSRAGGPRDTNHLSKKKGVWQQQPAEHQDWEFIDLSDLSADYEYKSI
jgi:hypothetical protein